MPDEGKSFCALNYAVALASQGYRPLLIDGDLRRVVFVEDLRIDVDVNERFRDLHAVARRGDLAEAGAYGYEAIAVGEGFPGGRHSRGAESHARVQGMIGGKDAGPLQRCGYRSTDALRQLYRRRGRVARAPAQIEPRMAGSL